MAFTLRISPQPGSVPVLPLGDSTTYGTGNGGLAYRPYLLAALRPPYLVDLVGGQRSVASPTTEVDQDHSGVSGDFLSGMTTRVVTDIAAYRVRIVLVQGGINDIAVGASGPTVLDRLSDLLAAIYAADPTIATLVGSLPYASSLSYAHDVATFNRGIPNVVTARAALGQFVRSVDNSTGVTLSDGAVHPNDAGYQTIAQNWAVGLTGWVEAKAILNDPS